MVTIWALLSGTLSSLRACGRIYKRTQNVVRQIQLTTKSIISVINKWSVWTHRHRQVQSTLLFPKPSLCCTVVATRHGSSFWFVPSFDFLSLTTFLHWPVSVTGVKSGDSWQGGNWINQPWALWQKWKPLNIPDTQPPPSITVLQLMYRKSLKLRINMKISARKGGYPLFHIVNCISHGHTPFSISVPNPHSGSSSRCDDLISNITLYKRIRIGYHELNILQFQAGEQTSYIVMLIPIFSLSLVIYNNCQS